MRISKMIGEYPTVHEDPRDGSGALTGLYYCKKCVQFGHTVGLHDTYPQPPETDSIREIPCTICAMSNGGCWGWKKNHKGEIDHVLKSNGYQPGNSGIEDILNNHSPDPWSYWDITDEEVVLGCVQNGLYQHYKWKEIIDLGDGPSRLRPMLPPISYLSGMRYNETEDPHTPSQLPDIRYNNNWYWWKIIPYSTVLPKRLIKVLKELISDYSRCDKEKYEVPQTNQKKHESKNEENSWEYFFETYIEPGHVVHIFIKALEKVLRNNNENLQGTSTFTRFYKNKRNIPRAILSLYSEEDQMWLSQTNTKIDESFGELSSSMTYNDSVHFLVNGTGDIYNGNDCAVLKILDRDIFGTSLENVVSFDSQQKMSWNRDSMVLERFDRPPSTEELNKLWNMDDHHLLYFEVYKRITFEDTSWFQSDNYSDYDYEYDYRDIINLEYEVDTDSDTGEEETKGPINTEQVITSLRALQEIVDDDVKEHICENTYINLQNKMRDIYRLVKL